MRCKSCLEIFSQPSVETKRTQTCAVCRGVIRITTRRKEMCEKTIKILLNKTNLQKNKKKLVSFQDHNFIEQNSLLKVLGGWKWTN